MVPSAVNISLHATAVSEGVFTRRLRGIIMVMSFTVKVPPERMSEALFSVALAKWKRSLKADSLSSKEEVLAQ